MKDAAWYYAEGEEAKGPLALEQMQALLGKGVIRWTTLVCREGDDAWRPLEAFPDFHLGTPTTPEQMADKEHSPDLVVCFHCNHAFAPSLTLPAKGGRRICKLCHAQGATTTGPSHVALRKLGPLTLLLIVLLVGGSFLFVGLIIAEKVLKAHNIPVPILNPVQWAQQPPAEWPSIICLTESRDSSGQPILCGASFVAKRFGKPPVLVTASRNLVYAEKGGQPRSEEEVDNIIEHLAFSPHTGNFILGERPTLLERTAIIRDDLAVIQSKELPPVRALPLRGSDVPTETEVMLIAPPAEAGGPQRGMPGRVLDPGSGSANGVVVMEEVFPVEWFLGAPFVDGDGKLIGVLQGQKEADLSKISERNLLIFVPVSRLRPLLE